MRSDTLRPVFFRTSFQHSPLPQPLMRCGAWLALLAMLALALVPTVSHALAASRGAVAWAEVCTPQGTRVVALADQGAGTAAAQQEDAPSMPTLGGHLEHCAFCALSFGAGALPPVAAVNGALALESAAPPALFLQAPRTLFAWRQAQPRAPPF